eukprot:CAMPEP_0117674336 /NCGR_PEP_ID=MMETSP0804-20121206/14980_1 /TAXON_ID=1074897 /ORGANISM="Tetraselmis astigmatica, Strain CCMP880" /LENGTH=731 /DNA_ID=CAMNT_0005483191 /DNA_START=42 /DNA_END=2237 /DNA_ORIENTATION=+
MAGGEEKKKKEKKDKEEKGKKEEKKDRKKDKEDKKDKDKKKDKEVAKKEQSQSARPQSARPQPRRPPPQAEPKPVRNAYMDGLDLPSSDSEDDRDPDEVRGGKQEEGSLQIQVSAKDVKKQRDKERKLLEAEARAKQSALREEDVYDVSFQAPADSAEQMANQTDIKVQKLTIRAKGKLLLENTALTIVAQRRYGLVGPNGMGKTTLMKLIAQRRVPVPDNIDILLVEQEVIGDERTALAAVVEADTELMALRAEEAEITAKMNAMSMEESAKDEESAPRLNAIYERMNELGSSTAEARASRILHGLGFSPSMQARPTSSFSGGWRMRISLARALYIAPTLLLLDEPTNHLDLRAVLWLEEYLQRWKKTLVIVSHDRDFLNSVTTDIIHLHDQHLTQYRGNFEQFEEMYLQRRREANKAFEKYEKQIKAAKQSGDSKKNQKKVQENTKRVQKGKKGKNVEEVESAEAASAPRKWNDYTVNFKFPEPTELPPPLIQLTDADFKYPTREDFGLKDLNIGIDMGSRIVIVGPNGGGKTTLMNLLGGELEPISGWSKRSHRLRIGRYSQHFVDQLAYDVSPVQYLMEKFPEAGLKPEQMRAELGKFGLAGQHHLTPICKLSGGQKARVVFTAIKLSEPHILLLDEPTNNLDMQSIDALSEAIEDFEGGVVVISHDGQLLSTMCADEERSEVWIVEDGKITFHKGSFEDYRDELVAEICADLDAEEEKYQPPTASK